MARCKSGAVILVIYHDSPWCKCSRPTDVPEERMAGGRLAVTVTELDQQLHCSRTGLLYPLISCRKVRAAQKLGKRPRFLLRLEPVHGPAARGGQLH